ncbi:hypothetical protein [Alkaliphilus transvaalensis]|uniref:hypothetical protein n=1 Tax=Alkaliphilus transvaalensis TaxID=114628 RepID=UPI00047B38F1|nr:hypothetical protein [Alkaliphilus transvaalensis]
MAKLISFHDYIHKKNNKKRPPLTRSNPIGFSDIKNGILSIAIKDQELIYKNIKYNYYHQYVEYIQLSGMIDSQYSFINYIEDHLNLEEPFEILHGVDFSGEKSLNRLSDDDWENIADMIVRISLCFTLEDEVGEIDLLPLAEQYEWDYVLLDMK